MARRGKERGTERSQSGKRRRPRLGVLAAVLALGLVALLYYRPLVTYAETRGQLTERRAEVKRLRAEKRKVEARLEQSGSLEAIAREARTIGRVRPGEQLFIIKGIDAWRAAHDDR